MRLLMALRMAGDVSLLSALMLLIGPFRAFGLFFALCTGLCFLGTYGHGLLQKAGPVRFLPLALPLLSLLLFRSTAHMVFALLFTGYLIFMTAGGGEMSYWRYKPMCCVGAGLSLLSIILAFILEADSTAVCLLGAFQLLSSFFVLRQLRFGVSDSRGKWLDVACIAGVLLILGVIGLSVYGILQNDFSFLQTLLFPFAWLLQQLVALLSGVSNLLKTEPQQEAEGTILQAREYQPRTTMPPEYTHVDSPPPDPVRWEFVILILGVLVALYLLYRLLKWAKGSVQGRDDTAAALPLETEALTAENKKHSREEADSVKKIRKVYRDYLKFLQSRGLFFSRSKTSLDVEQAAESSPQALHANAIRQSYIRVRYGAHQPDAAEVKEAKKLLKEIKTQKKEQ